MSNVNVSFTAAAEFHWKVNLPPRPVPFTGLSLGLIGMVRRTGAN